MKNNNQSTFLILAGITILSIFVYVSTLNLLPNNSTNNYYSKNNSNGNTSIKSIEYNNGKIKILTDTNDSMICVKQTKSNPKLDSLCWKKTKNKEVEISVYYGKTYYIWLKDNENLISVPIKYIAS